MHATINNTNQDEPCKKNSNGKTIQVDVTPQAKVSITIEFAYIQTHCRCLYFYHGCINDNVNKTRHVKYLQKGKLYLY